MIEIEITDDGREEKANQDRQHGRPQHPGTNDHHLMRYLFLCSVLEQLTRLSRGIQGNTHVAGVVQELEDSIISRNEANAPTAQDYSRKLLTHDADRHLQALYTTKDARVLQYMVK